LKVVCVQPGLVEDVLRTEMEGGGHRGDDADAMEGLLGEMGIVSDAKNLQDAHDLCDKGSGELLHREGAENGLDDGLRGEGIEGIERSGTGVVKLAERVLVLDAGGRKVECRLREANRPEDVVLKDLLPRIVLRTRVDQAGVCKRGRRKEEKRQREREYQRMCSSIREYKKKSEVMILHVRAKWWRARLRARARSSARGESVSL
jgi:hypothetical protein